MPYRSKLWDMVRKIKDQHVREFTIILYSLLRESLLLLYIGSKRSFTDSNKGFPNNLNLLFDFYTIRKSLYLQAFSRRMNQIPFCDESCPRNGMNQIPPRG
jgi:hypothetical protein